MSDEERAAHARSTVAIREVRAHRARLVASAIVGLAATLVCLSDNPQFNLQLGAGGPRL